MTTPDTSIASRELDYFIHNKVLGHDLPTESQRARAQVGTIESYNWANIPHYSSSRAAAFELAWSFKDSSVKIQTDWSDGTVSVEIPDGNGSIFEGKRDDFPSLVCRAAITAKGLL